MLAAGRCWGKHSPRVLGYIVSVPWPRAAVAERANHVVLDVGGDLLAVLGEDLAHAVAAAVAGEDAPVGHQQPRGRVDRLVERQGVGDDAGGNAVVGHALADALVRAHGRRDQERVGVPGGQGLMHRLVIRRIAEPGPHLQLGRPGDPGGVQVNPVDDADLGALLVALQRLALIRPGHRGLRVAVPDQVRLAGVEQQQAPAEQPVALPGGDAEAAQRAAGMHEVDVEIDRFGHGPGPGEDGVQRADGLAGHAGRGGHDHLAH